MASENETVDDIVKRVRRECNSYPLPNAAAEMLKLVREIESAHKREIAELEKELDEWRSNCDFNHNDRKKEAAQIAELRECLKEAVDFVCGRSRCETEGTKEFPCFYVQNRKEKECMFYKWRKALKGAKDEGK